MKSLLLRIKIFISIHLFKRISLKDLRCLCRQQKILESISRADCSYQDYLSTNDVDFSLGAITNDKD